MRQNVKTLPIKKSVVSYPKSNRLISPKTLKNINTNQSIPFFFT